jgi:hypothetical protein
MRRIVGMVVMLWLTTLGVVQAQQLGRLAPGFTTLSAGAKVALAPVDVELFELSVGGVPQPKAEWTQAAIKHIGTALQAHLNKLGASLQTIPEGQADEHHELLALNGAISQAIAIHHSMQGAVNSLPSKEGKLSWSFGDAVKPLQQTTGADYMLLVWVRDSYSSPERKAAIVAAALLGIGLPGGIQAGFSTLVDMKTGDVVWFNRLVSMTGDLREQGAAANVINGLLTGFPDSAK